MSLECRGIRLIRNNKSETENVVLDQVDIRFDSGRLSLITGPTGAGKTTLLSILGCLLRPTSGEVIANGQTVSRMISWKRQVWRRNVGICFQHNRLIPDLTVEENVMLPLIPRRISIQKARRQVLPVLEHLSLTHLSDTRVSLLSGGEQQRTAMARALSGIPRYILADEPFAHQDHSNTKKMVGTLRSAAKNGAIVILTAHESPEATARWADDHFLLYNGRLQVVT